MLSRRFPSRPESSASPGAGGAGTAEPEPLSPPPSLLGLPSASPLGHELPVHSRRLQARCPPAAGSSGGGGAAPALSGFFFFAPSPPHPLHCPTLMPKERGALSRVLPPDGVPTLQQAPEPGQHLVSTLGGGGGGGEGSPTRSLIPPDRRRGLRGAPEGPEESPGYVAGLRSSTLRPPDCVPRKEPWAPTGRGGARLGTEGWVGPGHLVSAPPRQCGPAESRLVGRSVHPGCSPRESGDSEEALPPPFPHSLAPPSLPGLPV